MATVRLIVVLLVLGLVVLLGVQNLAPAMPLIFFGSSTQALPLGVWLAAAVLLGALTTLVLTALLGSGRGGPGGRSAAYKYRPQSFYEPVGSSSGPGAAASAGRAGSDRPGPSAYSNPASRAAGSGRAPSSPSASNRGNDPADDDPNWRDWTSLKSPGQWNDWETLSQAPKPETSATNPAAASNPAAGILDGVTTWFSSSKQRAKQQQRVDESLRELDDDWDGLENRSYSPPGVSPVQDSLDDINQGWEQQRQAGDSSRSFEASQAPRRVYRDGSLYSYSYREEGDAPAPSGQIDNIYAPPDDAIYGNAPDAQYAGEYATSEYATEDAYGSSTADNYGDRPDFEEEDGPLGEPEMADDGVVDADYRVIVPPYTTAAEAAASSETWTPDSDRPPRSPSGDEWDDADDALTP
ncbi:hypothetical protein [Nodosilinea nodulosa]|uniref:hypothetical protein n=1 Tax=Nodosilinea nodulosa TaxID=416001 RepID=UPI00030B027C|nr:hypothetical protein [Nodosilinea nodulosa]